MSTTTPTSTPDAKGREGLSILVADEIPEALARLAQVVRALGHEVAECALDVEEAADAIAREDPDAALVVVHDDPEHALDLIAETAATCSGPVIILLDGEDPDFIARAAARGVAAYACGANPDAISSALSVAVARHAERSELGEQVERLEGALARRGVIERAKGIMMERHAIDERAAFELVRGTARRTNRRVVDVARAVQDGEDITPPDPSPSVDGHTARGAPDSRGRAPGADDGSARTGL
jgi:AmiR/NasT family two-component response regulator